MQMVLNKIVDHETRACHPNGEQRTLDLTVSLVHCGAQGDAFRSRTRPSTTAFW
ncbi:hypothetical protein ACFQZ8_10220 [Micromonospora azadirachtae]|uniref:Uncharacterized protein n=1 Tax=Micromonospora azadirachtae TaxID=1970735 RepID=A0ABW3A068_9ACTN